MNSGRFGIWLIGAWGRIATAVAVELAALKTRPNDVLDLVSEHPKFAPLDLADWKSFVLGGHEIRKTSYRVEARQLLTERAPFAAEQVADLAPALDAFDKNIRTGTLLNVGPAIESLATTATLKTRGERPRAALARLRADLEEFRKTHALEHVVMVNLATAEPHGACDGEKLPWSELSQRLEEADRSPLPASTLYAVAAMQTSCSYVNYTSSLGSDLPALDQLALATGTLHMGRDGTTRPTFEKTDSHGSDAPPAGSGSDAFLAAAAVLDLVRFCEREHRRGSSGVMT